jgi:hypothetical protein
LFFGEIFLQILPVTGNVNSNGAALNCNTIQGTEKFRCKHLQNYQRGLLIGEDSPKTVLSLSNLLPQAADAFCPGENHRIRSGLLPSPDRENGQETLLYHFQ